MITMNRRAIIVGGGAALAAGSLRAHGQGAFPNRPVQYIVGYAPGGTSDILARVVAPRMSHALGQPVVVENRPGAGGSIATGIVARAKPDGHTIMHCSISFLTVNPQIMPITYDPIKDIEPLGLICKNVNILGVHPSVPVNTVEELVDYARKNPDKLTFGSPGVGNAAHITTEYFNRYYGLKMRHVPYNGSNPAIIGLLSGQIHILLETLLDPHIKDGKVKGLAVSGTDKFPGLPDLPSLEDGSRPNWSPPEWYQFMAAPRGLQADVKATLVKALNGALDDPDTQRTIRTTNAIPARSAPDALDQKIRKDHAVMAEFVKAMKLQTNN